MFNHRDYRPLSVRLRHGDRPAVQAEIVRNLYGVVQYPAWLNHLLELKDGQAENEVRLPGLPDRRESE